MFTTTRPAIASRPMAPANPDHHLWNNHGTWFVHYTRYPDPRTKERVRHSLRTRCRVAARRERDRLFAALDHGVLASAVKGGAR